MLKSRNAAKPLSSMCLIPPWLAALKRPGSIRTRADEKDGELWHRPAGPMNWKNPIRVFAVLGWLVVQGFVLLGWAGWRVFQGLMLLGWTGVSRRAIRCRASAPAALFFRRCVVCRVELCTASLPVA